MQVFAIRPEPGLSSTVEMARERGIEIAGYPLSRTEPVPWSPPDDAGAFDGLLVGSANVFRHGGDNLRKFRDLPVLAVGQTTADAALVAGFTLETIGAGGLQSVLDTLPHGRRKLLRLSGQDHVNLEVPGTIELVQRVVYRVQTAAISAEFAQKLTRPSLVLLHSGSAAKHFAAECRRLEIDPSAIELATLGPRISDAAGAGWNAIHTAPEPSDAALLALIAPLCH